jgi:hypothetical protein
VNGVDHSIERVRTAPQITLAAAVIADRFQHLATTAWLIDAPFQRDRLMLKNARMWAEHAVDHGEVDIVPYFILPDGRRRQVAKAAAFWLHVENPDSPPPLPAAYEQRLAYDCGEYAGKFAELDKLFEQHHPHDRGPHHYLTHLASMQERQRLGTALLRHHLAVLDNRGLGAYLVAADERSRGLYARHGFAVLEPVLELPGRDGRVEHVMYPMWRDPHPPQPDHPEPSLS